MDNNKDFAAVCCYFNPCHYKNKLKNYKIFREGIVRTGIKLLTVELVFGNDDFELSSFSDVLQLKTGEENIMWQMERLLNIGIQKLIKDGYEKIAWLGADVIFDDDLWVENLSRALDVYPICQGFKNICLPCDTDRKGEYAPGAVSHYYQINEIPKDTSCPGGVWAAKAEILKQIPLYDYGIIGGGDNLFFWGIFFSQDNYRLQIKNLYFVKNLMTADFLNHYFKWADDFGRLIKGRVGYTSNLIKSLEHGSVLNRKYKERHNILLKHNFNPAKDIKIGQNLCWEWASDKKELHREVRQYFFDRNED